VRLTAFFVAAIVVSAPAVAQSWREYSYPDYSFSVAFPAEPKLETTSYRISNGSLAPARVYSVAEPNCALRMTVVELSGLQTQQDAEMSHAIKMLSQRGEVKLDLPHWVNSVSGRQLSVAGHDGSHSSIAIFYYEQRLYQIEGVALPSEVDGTADAIRFQQSLVFH
jgi:hypothetical protein